jgi:hypothetical protein
MKISMLALALGCAALATPLVNAASNSTVLSDTALERGGSSNDADLRGDGDGALEHAAGGVPRSDFVTGHADTLRRYCEEIFREHRQESAIAGSSAFRPGDCVGLFVTLAQYDQPARGGDGGGFPGLPGGRGGESGGPGGGRGGEGGSLSLPGLPSRRGGTSGVTPNDIAVEPALIAFCMDVLQSRGRTPSDDYRPSDCAYYLLALDRLISTNPRGDLVRPKQDASRFGVHGRDGPSIDGGIGGRGGRAGTGPGGGRGGAGGIGLGGGIGGAGGAGGASR